MELNTTTLRGILAQILSVDTDHVVPKQGNWWNPQENTKNIANWCAYRIKSNRPRLVPFYDAAGNDNAATTMKIAEVELQFVGPQSEDLAQSIAFWSMRSDVQRELKKVHGAILLDDYNTIPSVFYQEGNNTITAWNVTIRIAWYSYQSTGQGPMQQLTLQGKINK